MDVGLRHVQEEIAESHVRREQAAARVFQRQHAKRKATLATGGNRHSAAHPARLIVVFTAFETRVIHEQARRRQGDTYLCERRLLVAGVADDNREGHDVALEGRRGIDGN